MLPAYIEEIFFKVLNNNMEIADFEQWLYHDKQLESVIKDEDYLELISLGYRERGAKYELLKIINRLIEISRYEKWRLLKLLDTVLVKNDSLPQALMDFYDLRNHGYSFLDVLGIEYGLKVEAIAPYYNGAEDWDKLPAKKQNEILQSFCPGVETEARKVIALLNENLVVPMGKLDELNYWFVDNRTEKNEKA